MSPIKYVARIYHTDDSYIDYKFFARSKEEAKKVARELHYKEYSSDALRLGIKAESPSASEIEHVNKMLVEVIVQLKEQIVNKTYDDFIQMFIDFDGWDLILSPNSKSFMLKFKDFTCKIVYNDGVVSLDESEILYYSEKFNRVYSIRDYCLDIFISVG